MVQCHDDRVDQRVSEVVDCSLPFAFKPSNQYNIKGLSHIFYTSIKWKTH
jgi:hypothetical protein